MVTETNTNEDSKAPIKEKKEDIEEEKPVEVDKEKEEKNKDSATTTTSEDSTESDLSSTSIDTDSEDESKEDKEPSSEEIKRKRVRKPRPEDAKKFLSKKEESADFWVPKTRLGELVKNGEITTMKDAIETGLPIREPEVIDILLPELDDEVLDVNMVQRMTDSGRRVRFSIMTVVGNGDGFVGLGSSKGKEVGPAIRKAIDNAKLNIIEIRRGCGSWECGCDSPHTLPFTVEGKSGSTVVTFRPAPRGVGLAVGDVAKHILRLSGIKDAWGFTRGETRTTINYAKAVFIALQNSARQKTTKDQIEDLKIISGPVELDEPVTELTEVAEEPISNE